MSATNENSRPTLTIVPANEPSAPPLEVSAIGSDLIDEVALAVRLGISRSTLQSWRYSGRGPRYIKLGRLVRYRNADVEAYLNEHVRGNVA